MIAVLYAQMLCCGIYEILRCNYFYFSRKAGKTFTHKSTLIPHINTAWKPNYSIPCRCHTGQITCSLYFNTVKQLNRRDNQCDKFCLDSLNQS